jgi:hypothetical protein
MSVGRRAAQSSIGVIVALVAAVTAASCGGNSASTVGYAQTCSLNSDCDSPYVCVFQRCHQQCATSEDCATLGARCVASQGDGGTAHICQLETESTCGTTPCAAGQTCTPGDDQCRTVCQTNSNCEQGQFCVMAPTASEPACYQPDVAADESTLVAAGLVATDGAVIADASPDAVVRLESDAANASDSASTDDGAIETSDATVDANATDSSDAGDGAVACGTSLLDGACDYCASNPCTNGTCVNGATGYLCQCNPGYSGTKSCTFNDVCQTNVGVCLPNEYPCQPTAAAGIACQGQFATWTMPDATLINGQLVAKAAPHYSAANGIVVDGVTTLWWQQATAPADCSGTDAGTCTYVEAQAYCAGLNLGGFTDWRIPTKIELESLFDCTQTAPPYVNQGAFPNTPQSEFWSESTVPGLSTQWAPDFQHCYTYNAEAPSTTSLSLRCTRGTGITASLPADHYTINAGAIDGGVPDGGDADATENTVTDNWTGLTWEQSFSPNLSIADGMTHCASLGMRMPTQKELLTLVDPTRLNPAIDPVAFVGTPVDTWFLGVDRYIVHTTNGQSQSYNNSYAVRCVK